MNKLLSIWDGKYTQRKKSQPGWEDPDCVFEMSACLSSKSVSVQVVGNRQEEGESFSSVDSLEKHSRWIEQSTWIPMEVKKGQRKVTLLKRKGKRPIIRSLEREQCWWWTVTTVSSLIAQPSDSYGLPNLSSSNKNNAHLFVTNKLYVWMFWIPWIISKLFNEMKLSMI